GKICEVCGKDIEKVHGCIESNVYIDGRWYTRKRYTNDNVNALLEADLHCGDCGVEPGKYHHWGCNMEQCPRGGRQLISCECNMGDVRPLKSLHVIRGGKA
ncbi:MAG: hypothetical protein PHS17_10615, partial [Desulfobacterales bacterium]|nr:hypothetical protein [Desulfobacterales bacterium]